jgi:uncharacterized glyoxalase superfamily protein PhnB
VGAALSRHDEKAHDRVAIESGEAFCAANRATFDKALDRPCSGIDPLNKKQYGAVSAMLPVSDIPAAVSFYQKALGFTRRATMRAIMKGPDGKAIHAELTLRGTTLMLGPENASMDKRTAKSLGASPASLFIYAENVDKAVSKALNLGATGQGPVICFGVIGALVS